jgi:glycosyltransferase involved in cell wall biosynthesis
MKILIIDSLFTPYGGGQVIAYNTYKILKAHNHDVYYWAMQSGNYFENDYEFIKYFTPYYKGSLDYIKNPIKYYNNYRALKDLTKFVELIQPDVIHYQSFWGLSSAVFKVKTNAIKLLTIHDARCCPAITLMFKDKSFCSEQYCKNGNFVPCILNKCMKNSLEASMRRAFASVIDRYNFRYIDKFITPSNALREKMLSAGFGITEDKIITVNNFLSNNDLNTKPSFSEGKYFLYIGRLSKEKGVIYLLEAMKDLPREINLHIVGTGAEENNLKEYVKLHNLDNVEFLGFKNREEIKEEYQNCISAILPCNWFEIFGLTNIESLSHGKPVIASNIGGIPEIVENNVNGLLFEPANVYQLKQCILKYWNNPVLAIEHGKNGYNKALKMYTEEKYYEELNNVYKEVLNEYQ